MPLTNTNQYDNPAQPFATRDTFIPDQLVAGQLQLVTVNGTVASGSNLKRGTVLGQVTQGTVGYASGTQATGTVTFSGQPAASDTLTLNGTAITFVTGVPTGSQVRIGDTATATVINLLAFLKASSDTQLVKFLYDATGLVLTLTAAAGGTGGNSLTLAKSCSAITLSGSTLANGASNTGTSTFGTITRGTMFNNSGSYILTVTSTSQTSAFTLVNPEGESLPNGVVGTAYSNPELSFTLTAGGTVTAGDRYVISPAAGSMKWKLCQKSATDGSQFPAAILADDADAASADVIAGLYLQGEFNQRSIIHDPSWTIAELNAALRAYNIFLKSTISANNPD